MATDRQIEANRLNAQKSTGPRTEEGKAASRRNALSHGLTAMTLPDDDPEAVRNRTHQLAEQFPPSSGWEFMLVETMAREEIRMERIRLQQQAYRELLARRAALCWDEDRRFVAEKLFAGLARRPALVSRQLRQTRQGCDLLLERWRTLDGILAAQGEWTPAQRSLALDMLGVDPELRDGRTPLGDDEPVAYRRTVVRNEIERLEHLQASGLNELDQAEQTVAERGAAAPDATQKLYQRYESSSQRRFEWALNQLPTTLPATVPPATPPSAAVTAALPPTVESLFADLPPSRPIPTLPPTTPRGIAYIDVAASPPRRC